MLTTFGIFWSVAGVGGKWPGDDASLPGILAFVLFISFGSVALLRRRRLELTTT